MATFDTPGSQTYYTALDLTVGTTLSSTGGGLLAFLNAIDSAVPASLTLMTDGDILLRGQVGASGFLTSLTTNLATVGGTGRTLIEIAGSTVLNPSISTTGNQTFNSDVVLCLDTVLQAAGDVTFARTVNSDATEFRSLTVRSPGITWFKGDVGTAVGGQLGGLTTDDAGGAVVPLEQTRLGNGANTVRIDGSVGSTITINTATGLASGQSYGDDVMVWADATLNGQAVTFNRTVNSAAGEMRTLTVNSSGATTFLGDVGTAVGAEADGRLGALTTDAAGTTVLGNGAPTVRYPGSAQTGTTFTVRTVSDGVSGSIRTGSQTYNDDVTLAADTTLDADKGSSAIPLADGVAAVTFGKTVNSKASELRTLLVNAPGVTWFKGDVGLVSALGGLTTDYQIGLPSESTRFGNGTAITIATAADATVGHVTSGQQIYGDDVVLWAGTTLNGTAVTFDRTVNSKAGELQTLEVRSPGITWFKGDVGTAVGGQLGGLTTDDAGGAVAPLEQTRLGNGANTVRIDGSVGSTITINTATGLASGQSYGDDVMVWADATLNGQAVTFNRTVNSAAGEMRTLTVNSGGATTFLGDVGTAVGAEADGRLGALTTDAAGTTVLGNGALTVRYPGSAQTGTTLTVRTVSDGVSGSIRTGSQTYNDDVTLAADTTLDADKGSSAIPLADGVAAVTFGKTVNSKAGELRTLLVNAPGVTWFKGDVGLVSALGGLTTDYQIGLPSESTRFGNGTAITITTAADATVGHVTSGQQIYGDDVVLWAGTTLNGTAVTFDRTVNSKAGELQTLEVRSPGITWFKGDVGTAVGGQLGGLTTDDAGGAVVPLEQTRLGNGANTVRIDGSVGSTITINTATGLASGQSYGDDVMVWADATLNGQAVTFNRTVNSAAGEMRTLTVNSSGATTFLGDVGTAVGAEADGRLGALTTDAAGTTVLGNGAPTVRYPGSAQTGTTFTVRTVSDGVSGSIRTGSQTYNDDVTLAADTTLDADKGSSAIPLADGVAAVTFGKTVNSKASELRTLLVNAPGVTWFKGDVGTLIVGGVTVGQLGALTTDDAAGIGYPSEITRFGDGAATAHHSSTALTGSTITINTKSDGVVGSTRTGSQIYNDDAEVGADATLNAQPGGAIKPNIVFQQTVDSYGSQRNLTANAPGNEIFNGVVGGRAVLGDLITDGDTNSTMRGGEAQFNMTTTNSANPGGVNAGSVTTNDRVIFNVGGSSNGTPSVRTVGGRELKGQTYMEAAILKQNTVLTDTVSQDIVFKKTVDAAAEAGQSLVVNTGGITKFNGAVGGSFRLSTLTTDAAGSTEFNLVPPLGFPLPNPAWINVAGNVTINDAVVFNVPASTSKNPTVATLNGTQTYNGKAKLAQTTYLASQGGDIVFNNTVDGPYRLTMNAGGKSKLHGDVDISTLDVTGKTGIELGAPGGIKINTTASQTYHNDVVLIGLVKATSTGNQPITFQGRVDGSGGLNVKTTLGVATFVGAVGSQDEVSELRVSASDIRVADVHADGDAVLDAGILLTLNGAEYESGKILGFNPTVRASKSGSASTVKPLGNLSLKANRFVMGLEQKLTVNSGSLTINASSALVGDIAASTAMVWNIGSLTVQGRPAGSFTNANRQDEGVSFVSPTITFNGSIVGVAPSGKVLFGTLSGLVDGSNNVFTVPGTSVRKQDDLSNQFDNVGFRPDTFLQPLAGGLVTTINSSVTPVVPVTFDLPRPFLFSTDPRISSALIEQLLRLGINARIATPEELLSINIRQGVFNQPKYFIEPDDVGYEVVVNRITSSEAKRVTELFEQMVGKEGFTAIHDTLDKTLSAYFTDTKATDVDADKLLTWLDQKSASDSAAGAGRDKLKQLASLFNEIESMGLTDIEVTRSQTRTAENIGLGSTMSNAELIKAIKKLQPEAKKSPAKPVKKKAPAAAQPPAQAAAGESSAPVKHGNS